MKSNCHHGVIVISSFCAGMGMAARDPADPAGKLCKQSGGL